MKKGTIYRLHNKVNDKSYIGITRDRDVRDRIEEHLGAKSPIGEALRATPENFEVSILEERYGITDEELFALETQYIRQFNSEASGYNQMKSSTRIASDPYENISELSEVQERAIKNIQSMTYVGKKTPSKKSFWGNLNDKDIAFVELLMYKNPLTNSGSKFYSILHHAFKFRKQRYIPLEVYGEQYATDNLKAVQDLIQSVYGEGTIMMTNPTLENFEDALLLKFGYRGKNYRVNIKKVLIEENEFEEHIKIDSVYQIFHDM